ncbi:37163_t:CDS:2, partial [Gigaspora margarita]
PKNINFCELVDCNETNNLEVYNVSKNTMPKSAKRPVDLNWDMRLRGRKVTKVQHPETNETRQEMDSTQSLDLERIPRAYKPRRKQEPSVVDTLSLHDVAKDILSLPATATEANLLNYEEKHYTMVARCLVKIQGNLMLAYANKSVEVPISNTRIESLKLYKKEEDYNSEGGDTFDEFDYEKEKEINEVTDHFIEEYQEENSALFLTNVVEVPIEENKKKNSVESKIKQVVKNNDLIPQQARR